MEIINLGNRVVNTYLVKINKNIILIDTGYQEDYDKFLNKLSENNILPEEIDYIVLTHAHDDHAGFLSEVISASNAQLILHEEAVRRLLLGHNEWIGGCSGVFASLMVKAMSLFGKGKHEYPKYEISKDVIIFDGQNQFFEDKGIPAKLIPLPGHTKDHIGVLVDNKNMFCGDAAMNGFPSIKRNIIWIEQLESYKKSWDTMINMNFSYLYPSHGKPFLKEDLMKYRNNLDFLKLVKIKPKI